MQTYRRHVVTHVSLTAIIARAARAISGRDWRIAGSTGYCLMMDLGSQRAQSCLSTESGALYFIIIITTIIVSIIIAHPAFALVVDHLLVFVAFVLLS